MNPAENSSFLTEERESESFCVFLLNRTAEGKDNHGVWYRSGCDLSADTSAADPVDIHFMLLDRCCFITQGEL